MYIMGTIVYHSLGCSMRNVDKVYGMTDKLEQILKTVELLLHYQSPAHDFQHILRVYRNAEMISKKEQGVDLDIVLAAALLHDLVVYPKGSMKAKHSADESADIAKKILSEHNYYSSEKIEKIACAIRTHSYSKSLISSTLEGKILQDADRMDALGAIGIARTFSVGDLPGLLADYSECKEGFIDNFRVVESLIFLSVCTNST